MVEGMFDGCVSPRQQQPGTHRPARGRPPASTSASLHPKGPPGPRPQRTSGQRGSGRLSCECNALKTLKIGSKVLQQFGN